LQLAGVVEKVALDCMGHPRMLEERGDVKSTVCNEFIISVKLDDQARGILGYLNQKDFIDVFA
jgi:hypothetical protein